MNYWPLIVTEALLHPECGTQCGDDEMNKKDVERRIETQHQKVVSRLTASADGGIGLLHKITKLGEGRRRCEEKRTEWVEALAM